MPHPASADLRIYTTSGRLVRALLSNTELASGKHIVDWDGRGDSGVQLASGKYIVQLRTRDASDARVITILP